MKTGNEKNGVCPHFFNGLGLEPATRSAEEFDAFLAAEVRKYAKLAQDIGLKLE
jgi:tripartite-type tricarboxylate transporter receptor subunit TctC